MKIARPLDMEHHYLFLFSSKLAYLIYILRFPTKQLGLDQWDTTSDLKQQNWIANNWCQLVRKLSKKLSKSQIKLIRIEPFKIIHAVQANLV